MATLNWIGKEAVVNHDKEVPFKLLEKDKKTSVGQESKNLIIHGDNLEALKALMPFYKGKVKCIYIDPPYNTGNESWVYNDNVNSPKIREWLGQIVKVDDLTKHDKWLCMMYPRLKLLKDLLSEDGVIFVSIDDNEEYNLRNLMNEIFLETNFISVFVRECLRGGTGPSDEIRKTHDYVIAYAKNKQECELMGLEVDAEPLNLKDNKGNYRKGRELNKWGAGSRREDSPTMWFPIKGPNNQDVYPIRNDGSEGRWRWGKKKLLKAVEQNDVIFEKRDNGTFIVYEKIRDTSARRKAFSTLSLTNAEGTEDLKDLFDNKSPFNYPKPVELVKFLISLCASSNDDIILDSFAGSGTTGQAVMDLNKDEETHRKFILVEMEDDVVKNVTSKRIEKAIKKYHYNEGFEYCEINQPLFNKNGQINENCSYSELASYIYFTETQTNIDNQVIKEPFIGESKDSEYYLIYRGKGKNDLTRGFVSKLKLDKPAVIYADRCLVDEDELREKGITFKQIPYEIKVY